MKTVFIADAHGNFEALEAVWSALERERADRVVFLGDIVGYGASPNECVEMLKRLTGYAVLGNHDMVSTGRQSAEDFNPVARAALGWTRARLTRESKIFLESLPLMIDLETMLAVHATPARPESWRYILNLYDAEDAFASFQQQLCFIAHSHRPRIFVQMEDGSVETGAPERVEPLPGRRYLINCGSVGQPRDGDPRSCYGVFDSSTGAYRLERVEYDIAAAQIKIIRAGLPDLLAKRLGTGM